MKGQKTVANLGKNGISTAWAYVLCIYLMIIELLVLFADSWGVSWMNNFSILGTIPEALLWYLICKRLFSEQKMEKDMYILVMISYGMLLLSDVFSFLEETETVGYISALIGGVTGIISMIMMWIRYDGAMKKYAIWSIICGVGLIVASLIFGDPAEMDVTGGNRIIMKYLFLPLLLCPYLVLIDVLREGGEEVDTDENDNGNVSADEMTVEPREESSSAAKTIRDEAVGRKKAAVKIIVLVISAIIIASALYCVSLLNGDSDTETEYDNAFTELEENPTPTHIDNYFFGTIVVSANKDGYTNIREKPSTASAIVGILYDGVKSEKDVNGAVCDVWENYAKLYGREGNWLHVETNDAEGYVHTSQIKVIENGIAVKK